MSKNKCDNCGKTKTKTFWDYEDESVLCDNCHRLYDKEWQKEIDRPNRMKQLKKTLIVANVLLLIFLFGVVYYFLLNGYGFGGYNRLGYDKNGFDRSGINSEGFNQQGLDRDGYNVNGFNLRGYNRRGYDRTGYNVNGYDSAGYDRSGYNSLGYNRAGYDRYGYDRNGYDMNGFDKTGYNRDGYDRYGNPKTYCGDNICNGDESCSTCYSDCGSCSQSYSFSSYDNSEPYYSSFCDKIKPYDLSVREAAATAIRNNPGQYSIGQLFDIYDWVKNNIAYQNVALSGVPYPAEETLITKSGDCKNQAVLIASMIEAIGGTAKVVADPTCQHAYTIVRFGSENDDISWLNTAVANHYGRNVEVNSFTNDDGLWVIFDPAGGRYPGNTLPECTGERTVYFVDSCLSCVQQYPDMPYTFGDKCYSQCPEGTIHKNNYACSPCPSGYWSYDNQCVTCQEGYVLYTDGKCHPI